MLTVLVVEDDRDVRELLQQILELADYRVVAVEGAEGAREAIQLSPAVVMMDVMLQGNLSGIELALDLKQSHPSIPIVAMSASDQMLGLARSTPDTFSGFLGKPYYDIPGLFGVLERAIAVDK